MPGDSGWGNLNKPPYTFISVEELAALLKSPDRQLLDLIIIDVRDSDFVGGHIKGCRNIPSRCLREQLKTLVTELKDYQRIIFHCALSQQRGPSAALAYSRARSRKMNDGRSISYSSNGSAASASSEEPGASPVTSPAMELPPQDIMVLRGGFTTFASMYGDDEDLVEDLDKRLWS